MIMGDLKLEDIAKPEEKPKATSKPKSSKSAKDKELAQMAKDAKQADDPKAAMIPVIEAFKSYINDKNSPKKEWASQHLKHLISRYS